MRTIILAIESSCDDTSASVIADGEILSNCVANQEIHRLYGGVVPEVASRAHQANIIPVVDRALREAGVDKAELSAVAFTRGPGLIGSLIVGVSFAKGLAMSLGIPLVEVHHMQAHVLAHFAEAPRPDFPFLCLTVSGGHTQIVVVRDFLEMEVIGSTIDDAAGEAFDKTGKLLGLDYPAGPHIDRLARQGTARFEFPEPQIPDLDFSFSGLKTSILYFLKKELKKDPDFIKDNLADICASVQDRIVSILMKKLRLAVEQTDIREVAIAGGVSANSGLRNALESTGRELGWRTYIPAFEYCTDNAAMIAVTAYHKYLRKEFAPLDIRPVARWEMG
ncbi:tRNA (adenosine(37)-N6)-threonylcarbamoyltransferase complex transferase subunit TsaD [Flavilitoribacter nigricans]|uniref:tRNA N6-adenosine threonylcarbamoyltransferase n=1 Tax=Flavilitoribacter nigricans (strain ATCC 23147 / DSM 23189 / NBRC 102662 / NCIMB 1420 / SS-2) TaxID=1122177 RepID=A0A2D0N206_FLAN2|nr:tRNA (adenosine(37)-N6)-threonylcarbamoyltransferase complex transferase subunit TsaD [Flavilitoribacter nigricans]PHN01773.1 tRNA (adenosine(37)-N6)-threonylcarbamoyltransferase complex transferase subunit TsaD [Flavilitoribacter nigricans DSM 23189 = NBRC 102662]